METEGEKPPIDPIKMNSEISNLEAEMADIEKELLEYDRQYGIAQKMGTVAEISFGVGLIAYLSLRSVWPLWISLAILAIVLLVIAKVKQMGIKAKGEKAQQEAMELRSRLDQLRLL
jgi:hypothetical protein